MESIIKQSPQKRIWSANVLAIAWLVLLVFGTIGMWSRLSAGHERANYGRYVTWGLWVSGYIYFIGLSAGAFLISSLVYGFRVKKLERLGLMALYLAIITLFLALFAIWFDLGHMGRFYYIFTHPNFSSMMTWMVWLYTLYFVILISEFWFALRPHLSRLSKREDGLKAFMARKLLFGRAGLTEEEMDRDARILRFLALFGVPLAIAFHGGVGALFGTIVARPYWHTPLFPILFLTGALVSGGGMLTAIMAYFWKDRDEVFREQVVFLGRVVLGLIILDVLLEFAEYSIPIWYRIGPEFDLMMAVLFGEYWWVFWIFHIGLGVIIPTWLLLWRPRSPAAVGTAGGLLAISFMAVRLNIVVPGLIEPQLMGLRNAYQDSRLLFEYLPGVMEWQVLIFIACTGVALFFIGHRFLPLFGARNGHNGVSK